MLQLIIPAFNEEARLPGTLRDLHAYLTARSRIPVPVEVVVVDNASTDGTARVARDADAPGFPVRVVTCLEPGKGAAVRAGIATTDAELVGFMDADGATGLEALDEAWRLLACGADVAIGSRAVPGARTMVRHSAVREGGAAAYRRLAGRIVPGIADTQCGLKLMRGDLARTVFADLRTAGFSFDVEMLARARTHGASVAEFAVTWVDVAGSTFSPARHGLDSFLDLARIRWSLREARRPAGAGAPVRHLPASPVAVGVEQAGSL